MLGANINGAEYRAGRYPVSPAAVGPEPLPCHGAAGGTSPASEHRIARYMMSKTKTEAHRGQTPEGHHGKRPQRQDTRGDHRREP